MKTQAHSVSERSNHSSAACVGSRRRSSVLAALATLVATLLLHAGHEVTDTEVLDQLLKGLVLAHDVLNLDLGLLRDEVHLALAFLL